MINALPFQVSGGSIERQIADLMSKKKLPMVAAITNASDHSCPCKLSLLQDQSVLI